MEIGELYLIQNSSWLSYTTKEQAKRNESTLIIPSNFSITHAVNFYNNKYNCKINYIVENTCFMLLEQEQELKKILDQNGNISWLKVFSKQEKKYFKLISNSQSANEK